MKYYNVSDYYEGFEKYAKKSNREFNAMLLEFCDEDIPEIRQILSKCLNDKEKEIYTNTGIPFFCNKSGLIWITPDDIKKDERVCVSHKEVVGMYKCQCKLVKGTLKTQKQAKKGLSKNKNAKIHKFFTISPFKRHVFTHEKFNMAFRVKKCSLKNQPIVVYFHGGGNGGNSRKALEEFRLPYLKLMKKDCTIILPQTPYKVPFEYYISGVKELIEIIAENVDADKNRIYVFGGSAGGRCTWQLAHYYPDFIACALPLSGELYELNENKDVDFYNMKNLPMWISHSSDDNIMPIDNDDYAVSKLKEIGAPIKYSRYDKYGHGVKMAYRFYLGEKWVDWMFNQSLENR